jgi:beta-lactamase class A
MRKLLIYLPFLVSPVSGFSQKTDNKLLLQMEQSIKGFNGDIGIYVKNLRTGKTIAISADSIFPTASIVKVPILVGIMSKIETGELNYDDDLIYKDSLLYEGVDILGSFKTNEKIVLKKVIMLMLTTSDNTASLWLQSLAGTGTRINELLDSIGLRNTRVNSRTTGRENNRTVYGWGQTTPHDMGLLLEMIYRNKLFSTAACERMMRCLGRNFWDENEAISQIPPYIEVFSKNGCVDAVRSEVLLVNAPNNPYIFCVFTKNNKDSSWKHDNEAWSLARKISKQLWDYFEPKDNWEAAIK